MKVKLILFVLFVSIKLYSQEYKTYDAAPKSNSGYIKPISLKPLKDSLIQIGGIKIHTQIHNSENVNIVFIPGYGSTQKYWYQIISLLNPNIGILTYDRTGYGKSGFKENCSDAKNSAIQLKNLLDSIKINNKLILVSHSYGSHIARLFTFLYPEMVQALLIIEEPHENLRAEMEKILKPKELEFYYKINEEMKNMPVAHIGMKAETKSMQKTFEQLSTSKPLPKVPCIVLSAGDKKSFNEFSVETKNKLKILEFDLQKDIAALIPGSKHYVINNSGHNLPLDQPRAVLEAISELNKKKH